MTGPRATTAAALLLGGAALSMVTGSFFAVYLAAFWTAASILVGGIVIAASDELAGSPAWSAAVRAALAPAVSLGWLLLIAFLPLALGLAELYPWRLERPAPPRDFYLNTPFFLARGFGALLLWSILGRVLARPSAAARPALAAAALVLVFITASFAAVDWIGSLQRQWYSSVLGLYLLAGQVITAYALGVIIAAPASAPAARRDMGNILLTMVLLHAYLGFSQFFIIWNGNTPATISWYLPRTAGLWGAVAIAMVLMHFAIPQALLLWRSAKESAAGLRLIATILLAARALEAAWLVLPAKEGTHAAGLGASLLIALGLGAAGAGAMLPGRTTGRGLAA
jgi:hypothetical protein